jgi:hypothetical protein
MANLDTMRGYAQNHYGEVRQYHTTQYVPKNQAAGSQVLREPLWNKGKPLLCTPPLSPKSWVFVWQSSAFFYPPHPTQPNRLVNACRP